MRRPAVERDLDQRARAMIAGLRREAGRQRSQARVRGGMRPDSTSGGSWDTCGQRDAP